MYAANVGCGCSSVLMRFSGCSLNLEPLLQGLPIGSLILEDLGYFGFPWLDQREDAGLVVHLAAADQRVLCHPSCLRPRSDV
jgi:hypothetical protein